MTYGSGHPLVSVGIVIASVRNPKKEITLWLFNIAMEINLFKICKPSINGPFSMAMLVITRG
jgi:hypothetical protein